MKKVAVWLSNEERDELVRFCQKEGRSMYSVLKEASLRIIQAESAITPKPPITPKRDSGAVAPSVKTVQAVSPRTQERIGRLEREIEKMKGNEQLWSEVTELKAGLGELNGKFSVLLLKLTKTEELENKLEDKIVETVAGVLDKLGVVKEGV